MIKEHIKGQANFFMYRDNQLWYKTSETQFLFPVPIEDIGTATFLAEEKASLMMRYIRKYMKEIESV